MHCFNACAATCEWNFAKHTRDCDHFRGNWRTLSEGRGGQTPSVNRGPCQTGAGIQRRGMQTSFRPRFAASNRATRLGRQWWRCIVWGQGKGLLASTASTARPRVPHGLHRTAGTPFLNGHLHRTTTARARCGRRQKGRPPLICRLYQTSPPFPPAGPLAAATMTVLRLRRASPARHCHWQWVCGSHLEHLRDLP